MSMEVDILPNSSEEVDILSTDNLPTPTVLSKYRLAGHFCSIAIKAVIGRCIPGANVAELCNLGDEGILSQVPSPSVLNLVLCGC
jgi:methionine aminopeptidase